MVTIPNTNIAGSQIVKSIDFLLGPMGIQQELCLKN